MTFPLQTTESNQKGILVGKRPAASCSTTILLHVASCRREGNYAGSQIAAELHNAAEVEFGSGGK
jgi:hypothetical protein